MADDGADAAIVDRWVGIGIEEGRLQDRGREDDLVPGEVGIGVDGHRRHEPFAAVHRSAELVDVALMLELVGAHDVAGEVATLDDQRRIVAPLVGIADLGREGGELGPRARLGLRRHPGEVLDAAVHRGEDIVHQPVGRGLGLGREVALDIILADLLAHRARDERDAALPEVLVLGRAVERGAVKGEMRVDERVREIGGVGVERVELHIILQHRHRRGRKNLGGAADRRGLADDEAGLVGHAHCLQIAVPAEFGRCLGELGGRQLVIGLLRVAAVDLGPVDLGDIGLERHDRVGAGLGTLFTRKLEKLDEIGAIGVALLDQGGVVAQIIIAIGKAETALIELEDRRVRVLVVGIDIGGERRADTEAMAWSTGTSGWKPLALTAARSMKLA